MTEVALALIEIGNCKSDHIGCGCTALITACAKNMSEVVITLIATGLSKSDQINNVGRTAFDYVCHLGLYNVAIEMLKHNAISLQHLKDKKPEWMFKKLKSQAVTKCTLF